MSMVINQCDIFTRYKIRASYERGNNQTNPSWINDTLDVLKYDNGSGAGEVNLVHEAAGTLAAGGTVTFDLDNITSIWGAGTVQFASVKGLWIRNRNANTSAATISLSGDFLSTNGLDAVIRPAGGVHYWCDDATGYAVTAGTGDEITLTNDSATSAVTYEILIIGESINASSSSSTSSGSSSSESSSTQAQNSSSSSSSDTVSSSSSS